MIRCLIVDDEPIALDIIENYVKKTPFLELKGRCGGVTDALKVLATEKIDLLFLDIQMPQINGLEFSKTLQDDVKVIFTTAFEQYALDGFKVNALGYLLKPFDYTEFLEAAMRAKEWFDLKQKSTAPASSKDSIFVKSEYKLVKIAFDKLQYVEGLKDYAKFYLEDQKAPVLSLMTLKSLEESLPDYFMRVHRSFIVNLKKVNTIERNEIVFGSVSIPVADKYKEGFQKFLSGE
jgi:two-component system LytT family response regulator